MIHDQHKAIAGMEQDSVRGCANASVPHVCGTYCGHVSSAMSLLWTCFLCGKLPITGYSITYKNFTLKGSWQGDVWEQITGHPRCDP